MSFVRSTGMLALVLAAGCGDDGSPPLDGGPDTAIDAGASDAPDARTVVAPAPPEPPTFTPCPAGWLEVEREGLVVCEPWPEGTTSADCAPHESLYPSEMGCVEVGGPCPAGDFAEDLPATDVLYVLAGASPGGDGTEAAPFATIAEAMAVVGAGGKTLALGKGRYEERVTLRTDLVIRGACARQTILSPAPDETNPTILLGTAVTGARVEGLTIEGGPSSGIFVAGEVTVAGVMIRQATGFGIILSAGTATLRDVTIRDTVYVDGAAGLGIAVNRGSTLDADRVAVEGSKFLGVNVWRDGSRMVANDLVVRDTQSHAVRGEDGRGLTVTDGSATVTASVFERNRLDGVTVSLEGSTLELTDALIRDNVGQEVDDVGGVGFAAFDLGSATLRRVRVIDNRTVGVLSQRGGTVDAADLVVRNTAANEADGTDGIGALADIEASLTLARGVVHGNRSIGVAVQRPGSVADLSDLSIRNTESTQSTGQLGIGLTTNVDAQSTVRRVHIEDNRFVGIQVAEGSTMTAEDVVVERTRSEEVDEDGLSGRGGLGLSIQDGSRFEGARVALDENRSHSLIVVGMGASADVTDLRVTNTAARDCATSDCADDPRGTAVGVFQATARIDGFVIDGAALCGVHLALGGEVDLVGGEVRGTSIGACVGTEGYDLSRLQNDVTYSDNGSNLDPVSLPVPDPPPVGGGI